MSTFLTPTNPPVPQSGFQKTNPQKDGRMAGGGRSAPRAQSAQKQNLRVLTDAMWDTVLSHVSRVDAVAHGMEVKWGIDRLPALVAQEWAEKFRSQARKYNNAVHHGSPADVQVEGERMIAAWTYLDTLATQAGKSPLNPPGGGGTPVVEGVTHEGVLMMVVRSQKEAHWLAKWRKETGDTRKAQVWALDEILGLVKGIPELGAVAALKETFGEAVVENVREKPADAMASFLNDEIPF